MFYAICYVSTANNLDQLGLRELLNNSSLRNQKQGISGILIHNAGNFLQYMEGEKEIVTSLFNGSIKKDNRHKNIITLFQRSIDELYFMGYESGFTSILSENKVRKLKAYINLLKYLDIKEVDIMTDTIENFLQRSA